jgi:16S rRNA A1518/A1519 N6-dimethyltransferase RsmA/KsgA/DIM1 with predicted DNA glycosylase/AP lyase activity
MTAHKKHLGQHFLHDPKLLAKIAASSPAGVGDVVLEIGPGDGSLTRAILDRGCRVIAVEYDVDLLDNLQQRFASEIESGQFSLVHADFLECSISDLLPLGKGEAGEGSRESIQYHVIANIPYYITGAILRKLLTDVCQPQSLALIMQREVGERIVCRDGKQSLLSLSVAVYGEPSVALRIARGAFNPPPDVDSVLLLVKNISRGVFENPTPNLSPESGRGIRTDGRAQHLEEMFFKLIHLAFAQKRKQMHKLVAELVPRNIFEAWCNRQSIPYDVRAEDVPLDSWIDLVLCIVE